ncbi:MFS transporter [Planctomycetales bacterium 10988]|nr:MFS transporter [Planctomycetales bacterium 10988]
MENKSNDIRLFWACFISLIATAFGFFVRGTLLQAWGEQFDLNQVQLGQINGVGLWPFAISIILFSLVIDKVGYGRAMCFAFVAHISYAIIVICAPLMLADPETASAAEIAQGKEMGYWMLYIGNLVFALGNGTVEAAINPVVATMFSKEKTKWLNILHAGWPGGLVLAGLLIIAINTLNLEWVTWEYKVGLIFLPALIYGVMMLGCKFPVNERVAAGSSYYEMLKEFGGAGALIVVSLITRELGGVFGLHVYGQIAVIVVLVGAFAAYVQSFGRPMFIFLLLIMLPLATTELGTDGWITSLMEPQMAAFNLAPEWVLIYTSFIMMILRFFAGSIVHRISPIGLLMVSSIIAAVGLSFLSVSSGLMILLAATVYGFGKTFFWPTMLGVVAEQFPKGGALTLNAAGGVGMLGVGVLGMPFIGLLQETTVTSELKAEKPAIYEQVVMEDSGVFGAYEAVDPDKVQDLNEEDRETVVTIEEAAKKGALFYMAGFPCLMLLCYFILFVYFQTKGGYKAKVLVGHGADDEKFTGGVEGPADA